MLNPSTIASVAVRASRGGGFGTIPARVYLLQCKADADGNPVIPSRATCSLAHAHRTENARATRRMRLLVRFAEQLAKQVNAGELEFADAAKKFRRYKPLDMPKSSHNQ